MPEVKIEELNHHDAKVSLEIHSVLIAAYSREAKLIGAKSFPPLDRPRSEIVESPNCFYGVLENGGIAAVLELEKTANSESKLGISALCVAPLHSRRGYGTALVNFAISLGKSVIEVSTASANAPALALYEKMGFQQCERKTIPPGISIVHLRRRANF